MRIVAASLVLVGLTHLGCSSTLPDASLRDLSLKTGRFDVRAFGALGDGKHIDSQAINDAIDAASAHGGGTVVVPAGDYLCYSIRLKSNIRLELDAGATIVAADAKGIPGSPGYDAPEPNAFDHWEDFGHSHFHNSLIWGDGLENVSITGPGRIWGKALSSGMDKGLVINDPTRPKPAATTTTTTAATKTAATRPAHDPRDTLVPTPDEWTYHPPKPNEYPNDRDSLRNGIGNKSVALLNCHNVTIRDVSVLEGGHFGFLLTGCDNLTIGNVTIDTNRDGMDLDNCRNVRVSNCAVNSPNDDGICLKSSYALGSLRACEDITITNCYTTGGYRIGTLLNGKRERLPTNERGGRTGRIKFGTESNGGYKNIAISNCVMEYCYGLAIESVDGAIIQDVSIDNLVMRDITMCPIFIRLGNRARGPDAQPGIIRRVNISNVVCSNANWRFGSIITGLPGHPIEDLHLSNIQFQQQGGGTAKEAVIRPMELAANYPEPDMFGTMPASGFFLRHVRNLSMTDVDVVHFIPDERPLVWLEDVIGAAFDNVRSRTTPADHMFAITASSDLSLHNTAGTVPATTLP